MSSAFKLRRFSSPDVLQAIYQPLLLAFLEPYRAFLAGRSLDLAPGVQFDYDSLASILMSPDETTPTDLLDALVIVDETSRGSNFESLSDRAEQAGIPTDDTDTVEDVALRIWLANPHLLETLHAELYLVKRKSFQSFLTIGSHLPDVTQLIDADVGPLELAMNRWFTNKRQGWGTRVFPFTRDERIWFLVRHGEPYKRQGTLEDGQPKTIFYRPLKFDVLMYNRSTGELAIHANTKGQKKMYCEVFGRYLFGSRTYFDATGRAAKYTLEPIRRDGRRCLNWLDVRGIQHIALTELRLRHRSYQFHEEVHRADDVFKAFENNEWEIHPYADLVRASFRIKFRDGSRARTIGIRPPGDATFERDSDCQAIHDWLARRGFLTREANKQNGRTGTILAVP